MKTHADRTLLALVAGLLLFGAIMIYDASVVSAYRDFGDKFHYIKYQGAWILLGLIPLFVLSRIDYHAVIRVAKPIFFVCTLLLVLVLIPGIGSKFLGARRWITLFGFSIQPAEFVKLSTVIFLASQLSKEKRPTTKRIVWMLVTMGFLLGLIMAEPDMGTSIVLAGTCMLMLYVAGAPLRLFAVLIPAVVGALSGLVVLAPYRLRRLTSFLDPFADRLGASYHINQVLIALGSGGLFGLGLGQSRQKYSYLPEATTDSIFAIIGEETGLLGALAVLAAFVFFCWRGFRIAGQARDMQGRLLAGGITTWIGLQALTNMAAMVSLIPLTGVPLPFISYGGSSTIATLAAIGLLLSVSRFR